MRTLGFFAFLLAISWPSTRTLAQADDEAPAESEAEGEANGEYDPRQMRTEGLDDEQARSRFRVGQALYSEGRFLEAAREFESSYELSRRSSLLFNAYLSFRDAGQLADSVRVLDMYLQAAPEVEDAERLGHRLAAMREQLEAQQAREAEQQAERERLEAEQEQLRLERIRAEREAELANERARQAEGDPLNPLGFVVGGVGVGMLVGAAVSGAIAQTRVDEIEDNCPSDRCALDFDLDGKRDKADRTILTADVLLFGGIATTAVGIVLLFVGRGGDDEDDEAAPEVSFGCGPNGCNAEMRMAF